MRHVTRFGRPSTERRHHESAGPIESDVELGTQRARAAILLMLALPGCAYLYQGEELGLPEVVDLPPEVIDDPIWVRSGQTVRGRDGCRVPLPWAGEAPPFCFGPAGSRPWLPQPADWRRLTAEAEARDPASMLSLYRAALRLRREHPALAGEAFRWLPSPDGTILFERGAGFRCAVNLSTRPMALPHGRAALLASATIDGDTLRADAAAWFEVRG